MVSTMARFRWPLVASAGMVAALSGCSGFDVLERPAWRTQAEETCLAENRVQESAWIQPGREIDGPGICGLHHPFKVRGLAAGTVAVTSTATLDCSMIPALDGWITQVLQPTAQARFGEPVVEIRTMGSYSCRGINNMSGANLSEHAFGNAIDIAAFVLQSGRELNVRRGWNGPDEQERAFLRDAHAGSCGFFTTVLGPGSNVFHYDHIHLDLAMHGNTSRGLRRICKPVPEQSQPAPPLRDNLPDPPPIEEEQDVAQAARPAAAFAGPGPRAFVAISTPRQSDRPMPPADIPGRQDIGTSDADGTAVDGRPADWDMTSSIAARR